MTAMFYMQTFIQYRTPFLQILCQEQYSIDHMQEHIFPHFSLIFAFSPDFPLPLLNSLNFPGFPVFLCE